MCRSTLANEVRGRRPECTYLIVDEINRGDIPRIFGELLTTLEKDKRGKRIVLPVSQEPFAIPRNVFLIGTMNTADRAPTPRPDYAIMRRDELLLLLDAKYRDLWEKPLPREMSRIDVTDPVYSKHFGQVCLRPVNLGRIEELVASNTASAQRARKAYAKQLAFGDGNPVV